MKSTGIVRKMDELGRVVIPKEVRREREINEGDSMEIFTEGDIIMLRKYQPGCMLCGELSDLKTVKGKNICKRCRCDIADMVINAPKGCQ